MRIGAGAVGEAVDVETDGELAVLCGGFGGGVFDVRNPAAPVLLGQPGRCQRVGLGPVLADGTRVVYAAHHGDSRSVIPFLGTFHVGPDGVMSTADLIEDVDVQFAGMAYADGVLYVAAHRGGLRVYQTDGRAVPRLHAVVDGFQNAWKVALGDGYAYAIDHDTGLHVLSLADPLAPVRVGTVPTGGRPRDLDLTADRLFVALGAAGFEVFDLSRPESPRGVTRVDALGSVQAVDAEGDRLAVAAWTHFALYDARTLDRLATERVVGPLEQDYGVALQGDRLFAAEWGSGLHVLEYRAGYVSPDLWLDDALFRFRGDVPEARSVILRNRGLVELVVDPVQTTYEPAFTLDATRLVVPPGEARVLELVHTPDPATPPRSHLVLESTDVDAARIEIPLELGNADLLQVGDELDERFGFLDPSGTGQVEGLDGHVVLLAYFGVW